MKKNKKILILGGEGFIGRSVVDFLAHRYDCYSAGIEKSRFKNRKDKFIKKNPYKEKLKNDYDAIIHLIDNPEKINKFPGEEKKLIENIGLNKKNHLIVFSSAAVYANSNSEYAQRKIKLEKIYSDYCKKNGIKLTIFRLFNVCGPYQIPNRQGSLVANIFVNYLRGMATQINDKSAKRDFIFSMDIGKFIHFAIKNSITGTIDLATNQLISIGKLIKILEEEIVKGKLPIIYKKAKENIVCPKAKNILIGKVGIIPLKDNLKKTFSFYKKNIDIIQKYNK